MKNFLIILFFSLISLSTFSQCPTKFWFGIEIKDSVTVKCHSYKLDSVGNCMFSIWKPNKNGECEEKKYFIPKERLIQVAAYR